MENVDILILIHAIKEVKKIKLLTYSIFKKIGIAESEGMILLAKNLIDPIFKFKISKRRIPGDLLFQLYCLTKKLGILFQKLDDGTIENIEFSRNKINKLIKLVIYLDNSKTKSGKYVQILKDINGEIQSDVLKISYILLLVLLRSFLKKREGNIDVAANAFEDLLISFVLAKDSLELDGGSVGFVAQDL